MKKAEATEIDIREFSDKYKPIFEDIFSFNVNQWDLIISGCNFKKRQWNKYLLVLDNLYFRGDQLRALLKTAVREDKKAILTSPVVEEGPYEIKLPDLDDISSTINKYFLVIDHVLNMFESCLFGLSGKWGVFAAREQYKIVGFEPDLAQYFLEEVGGEESLKQAVRDHDDHCLLISRHGMREHVEHILKSINWDPEEFEDLESGDDKKEEGV